MLCDVCGSDFNDASNLRRHKLTHYAEKKSFKCGQCDKAFARSDHLKKHALSVHGSREVAIHDRGPKLHACPHCDRTYALKKSLQRHMGGHEKAAKESRDGNLIREGEKRVTQNAEVTEIDERNVDESNCFDLTCPRCSKSFITVIRLRQHIVDEHEYRLTIEQRDFTSMDEFWMWKESMEHKEFCSFVNRRGVRNLKSGTKYYFECHRSGVFHSKGAGKRLRPADKQTAKMGSVCPATITLTVSNETFHMKWCKEHFGHDSNINFLRLTQTERNFIADRLKNGDSFDTILDDIRNSVETADDFKRVPLLNRHMWNILKKVEFKHVRAHPDDAISVDILVETLKKRGDKNPVKFVKTQGQPCCCTYDNCMLKIDDFMIVLCTPYQQTEFNGYLEEKVLIDSTHGMNDYDFQLTTLATVDSAGEGVPVVYCISSNVNTDSMTLFFNIVKDTLCKTSSTKAFMSDMAGEFYNAWKNVFGEAGYSLFCTWHVDKQWRENTKEKVKGLTKQAEVYRALIANRSLLEESGFEAGMAGMRVWLSKDNDTKGFVDYFDKYYDCRKKWASCYRVGRGINNNMIFESLSDKLKYSYMKSKKLCRVDECIHFLLRFSREVEFDRLRQKLKGTNTHQQAQIVDSHKESDLMSADWLQDNVIEVTPGLQWRVRSFKPNLTIFYDVYFYDNICHGCELVCVRCHYCAHEFKCSCHDNRIKGYMCKHIHSVVKVFCIEEEQRSEEEEDSRVWEEEIESICETTGESEVGIEGEKTDTWKPIAMNIHHLLNCFNNSDSVPDAVVQGGLRFLEVLRREMPQSVQVQEEPEAVMGLSALKTLARTPGTPRCMTQQAPQSPVIPRRVSPQRRLLLHSVKKRPMKKKKK